MLLKRAKFLVFGFKRDNLATLILRIFQHHVRRNKKRLWCNKRALTKHVISYHVFVSKRPAKKVLSVGLYRYHSKKLAGLLAKFNWVFIKSCLHDRHLFRRPDSPLHIGMDTGRQITNCNPLLTNRKFALSRRSSSR